MSTDVSPEIKHAIAAANENFMTNFQQGDAAGVASLYTEDGQVLPPGSDFVTGRSAIQQFWQGAMDMGIKAVKLETVELDGQGDTAIETGKYTLTGEGGQIIDTGKYMVVWKQQEREWRLHRDIWNTSLPPQGQ